jgi:hypothetical protein
MTPKEKAEELFDKYYRLFNNFPNYQYVIENLNTIQDEKLYTAKQCALIAVNEILQQILWDKGAVKYWNEVKQEIEKL